MQMQMQKQSKQNKTKQRKTRKSTHTSSTHQGAGYPSLPKIQNAQVQKAHDLKKEFHPGGWFFF